MGLPRDIARSHLETLVEGLTGTEKAVADQQGDYFIRTESAGFFARIDGDEPPVIRVYAVVAAEVEKSPDLLESLNDINTSLSFVRTMWVNGQVLFEGESLALSTETTDFTQICRTVAMAADRFGPELISRFGGRPFFQATKEPGYSAEEPEQPGYL